MPRTVNEVEFAAKYNEILAIAQRHICARGYERMSIKDIRHELGMSNGAFYYYFDSKPAVLEALIEQIQQEAEQPILLIVQSAHLTALEKLQQYLTTLDRASNPYSTFIAGMFRIWLDDDNAVVREKVYTAMAKRRTPLLASIIHQGVQEGVFTTGYPHQTGELIQFLTRGLGDSMVRLMLALDETDHREHVIESMVAAYAAYADALERLLGAPAGCLYRYDVETTRQMTATLRNE